MKISLRSTPLGRAFVVSAVCLLVGAELMAQYAVPGTPRSVRGGGLRAIDDLSRRDAPSVAQVDTLWVTPPAPTEIERSSRQTSGLLQFAYNIPTRVSMSEHGRWMMDATGGYVWRCTIASRGAISLGLRLDGYQLPSGASLYLYGSDGRVYGAFTEINNSEHRSLQIAPIEGSAITLEYELPRGQRPSADMVPPFHIGRVSYGFRDALGLRRIDRSVYGFAYGEPYYDFSHSWLTRLSCAPNMLAYPEYTKQGRSVVLMVVDGSAVATGALINNTRQDGTAYLLTSAHCVNQNYQNETNLATVRSTAAEAVFFFGFDSPSPDLDIRPSEEKTLSGAELVAYAPEADMALLRITGLPTDVDGEKRIPASYNAFFAGWSREASPTAPFFGVHHPRATTKRYSEVEGTSLSIEDYSVLIGYDATTGDDLYKSWTGKHWYIPRWLVGTTSAGSSGSPLFDGGGRIIGALTGGASSCSNPRSDYYWALGRTWTGSTTLASLSPYLDPDNSGVAKLDGYDPLSAQPLHRHSRMYAREALDHLSIYEQTGGVSGLGRRVQLSKSGTPLGAYLVFAGNATLQSQFPSLVVELRALEGETVGEVKWSTEVSATPFVRYDETLGDFTTEVRTLQFDSIELFVPSRDKLSLPAGDYVLGVRSSDGTDLTLPLLANKERQTVVTDFDMPWTLQSGSWSKGNTPINYWVDLLVQNSGQSDLDTTQGIKDYRAFAHAGKLYVYNPETTSAEVYIYALDGMLIQRASLPQGESTTSLERLLAGHNYIVHIVGQSGKLTLKVAGASR